MQPTTRLWMKILFALIEIAMILIAAMTIGGTLPYWLGAIVLTILFASRMFYVLGGVGGYLSYRASAKEALRGKSHDHRP